MSGRDWGSVLYLIEAEAAPAARRLADAGAPDRRAEAHLVACLLQAAEAAGVRVGVSYAALVEAIEADRREDVRVIVSVVVPAGRESPGGQP